MDEQISQQSPDSQKVRPEWVRDVALVAILVVLALALRGWTVFHTEVLARDGLGFIQYALELESQGWSHVVQTNHQHPGYPLTILAVSWPVRAWSTGSEADALSLSAQLASNIAAVLLVFPMFFLGKTLFNRAVGFGAAVLFQYLPVPAHILSDGLSEALFLLLACSAMALAARALCGSKSGLFALCGVFCGLAYLTRPEAVVVLAAVMAVLLGSQLVKTQRRSFGQLLACGASLTVAAITPAAPYVMTTGGFSNKPSIQRWFSGDVSEQAAHAASPPDQRTEASAGAGQPLLASTFGISLNVKDALDRRVFQAAWGLGSELLKSFHYLAWVPLFLGMWWSRHRAAAVPGMWAVLVVCALVLGGLWRLAFEVGYVSERHVMLVVLFGCYPIALAVWELPGRWVAWRTKQRWIDAVAESHPPSRRMATVSTLMLCGMLVLCLPKAMERLHANRAGHHAAGLWLAEHAAPADKIDDMHHWAHYYAGRVFAEVGQAPANQVAANANSVRYVVVSRRDRDTAPTPFNPGPPDESKLQAEGGHIVYHWPSKSSPADASVVVYAAPASPPSGVRED